MGGARVSQCGTREKNAGWLFSKRSSTAQLLRLGVYGDINATSEPGRKGSQDSVQDIVTLHALVGIDGGALPLKQFRRLTPNAGEIAS